MRVWGGQLLVTVLFESGQVLGYRKHSWRYQES